MGRVPRIGGPDLLRLALLATGALCVATGLLPLGEAAAAMAEIGPLLLFLAGVVVLSELTREAQVFDVVATRLAIAGKGSYPALFFLCTAFASLVTIFLNLDTTAILLTPVMLALAARAGIAALPLAMVTLWLANTASLLLPVSNLTNLLAMSSLNLTTVEFAGRMWAPQAASIAVTLAFLWAFFWRRGARGAERYEPPAPVPVADPVLCAGAGGACLAFVAAIFAGVAVGVAAAAAAVLVLALFAVRAPRRLVWSLVPWRLLVFVTGLFLVVPTLGRLGLTDLMNTLIGGGGAYRTAFTGAGLANLVNNLPAYAAARQAVPLHHGDQTLALLIGANAGPLVTPWASLATLLWFEWCRRGRVRVPVAKVVLTGAGLAVAAVGSAVAALLLTA
ncbi:arsenic transporter [Microtetraspora sp. NBRC 13810]|uniref:SLC13 family permease n=1 Tax=Microtetraspora sp. NBRC 13810 TaxID=3030990 RepID=UPI00249FBF1E|nr:SLC13 family permease [Microtetraspora sp. NBRC 13810]GLW12254.1 arsenic transporter [Microtetraspora sp. NBRC 13810]